jgi:CRISPR-associated protein Cst2
LNVVDYTYPIDLDSCLERYKLALRAYEAMFLRMDGAMTSTRLPHLESFAGAIVVSRSNDTVPAFSPLADDYLDKLNRLSKVKNEEGAITFEVMPFADVVEFVTQLRSLTDNQPYRLQKARQERE